MNPDALEKWRKVLHNEVRFVKHGYYITKHPTTEIERRVSSWHKCRENEDSYFKQSECPWSSEGEEFLGTQKLAQALSKQLSIKIEETHIPQVTIADDVSLPSLQDYLRTEFANIELELEQQPYSFDGNPQFRLWDFVGKFSDEIKELAIGTSEHSKLFRDVKKEFEKLRDSLHSTKPKFDVTKTEECLSPHPSASENNKNNFSSLADTPEDAWPGTFFRLTQLTN